MRCERVEVGEPEVLRPLLLQPRQASLGVRQLRAQLRQPLTRQRRQPLLQQVLEPGLAAEPAQQQSSAARVIYAAATQHPLPVERSLLVHLRVLAFARAANKAEGVKLRKARRVGVADLVLVRSRPEAEEKACPRLKAVKPRCRSSATSSALLLLYTTSSPAHDSTPTSQERSSTAAGGTRGDELDEAQPVAQPPAQGRHHRGWKKHKLTFCAPRAGTAATAFACRGAEGRVSMQRAASGESGLTCGRAPAARVCTPR
mgnify:CR=1 FL=1